MKVDGQLESATLEQLATNPATSTQGRVFDNTTSGKTIHDSGTEKRAILKNDSKLIIGNDVVEANNVRIHKAGTGVLQDVPGNDVTAEGASATTLAQRSTRAENLTNATLPANGNAGRHSYLTDQKVLAEDDGTAWRRHIAEYAFDDSTAGSTITLAPVTSSVVRLTGSFSTLNMIPAGFSSQRVTLINRSGADVVISHDSGATPEQRIFTGTGANLTFKSNSSLPLYYDGTTQRWQVVGETAGATAAGGGVPNSSVITVAADYSVLVTDDIVLVDASERSPNIILPDPVGNLGLRITIEKIGTRATNRVRVIGTINGIPNDEIWPLFSPYEVVSNGTEWRTISPASALDLFLQSPDPATFLPVVAASTANVVLEDMGVNALTNVDNTRPNTNQRIILKNQIAPEENGVYLMPGLSLNSSGGIAASSTASSGPSMNGNENIATLANGSIVNATVVSTGQKVALRFQTIPTENGIYVIGANPGETVRDISQRDPLFTTPQSLRDFVGYVDVYNYPLSNVSFAAIEIGGHTNDRLFFANLNINSDTFTDVQFSSTLYPYSYSIKVPSFAKTVNVEICPPGGSGSGGTNTTGGGGGGGNLPITFTKRVDSGSTLVVNMQPGPRPGSGRTSPGGANGRIQITFPSPETGSTNFFGPNGGNPGVGGGAASASVGTPATAIGGSAGNQGAINYVSIGTAAAQGSGGTGGGGGGGSGIRRGGNGGNGSNSAGFLGGAGFPGEGFGSGGGGGGLAPASGRPGRGGYGGAGYVRLMWG